MYARSDHVARAVGDGRSGHGADHGNEHVRGSARPSGRHRGRPRRWPCWPTRHRSGRDLVLPADFASVMGYVPAEEAGPDGRLLAVRSDATCSSPFGGTRYGFDQACRVHDLGYDLLRYAARTGQPLGSSARQALDAAFGERMRRALRHRLRRPRPRELPLRGGRLRGCRRGELVAARLRRPGAGPALGDGGACHAGRLARHRRAVAPPTSATEAVADPPARSVVS